MCALVSAGGCVERGFIKEHARYHMHGMYTVATLKGQCLNPKGWKISKEDTFPKTPSLKGQVFVCHLVRSFVGRYATLT